MNNSVFFDVEEEEEDQEEEAYNDYEDIAKRNPKLASFFDDAAEDDDEDDSDDDDEDFADEEFTEEQLKTMAEQDRRREKLKRLGEIDMEHIPDRYYQEINVDSKKKSKKKDSVPSIADFPEVQPSRTDPRMYKLNVRVGKEQKVCIDILFMKMKSMHKAQKFPIYSAFTHNGIKGSVFVEGEDRLKIHKQLASNENVIGRPQIVDLDKRISALSITKRKKLKLGDYVRIKRGLYKDDLARIIIPDDSQGKTVIQLIPRLDYDAYALEKKRTRTSTRIRPPQRPFSSDELRQRGLGSLVREEVNSWDSYQYEVFRGMKFRNGFLFRLVDPSSLKVDNVNPQYDEIEMFKRDKSDEIELYKTLLNQKVSYHVGDRVEIVKGEFSGGSVVLVGKIVELNELDQATIKLTNIDFDEALKVNTSDLQKRFEIDDRILIIAGKYQNQTGVVVNVRSKEGILEVLTSAHQEHVETLIRFATLQTHLELDKVVVEGFNTNDIVELDASTVGLILKLEIGNKLTVLRQDNNVVMVSASAVRKVRPNRRASAMDYNNKAFGLNAHVKIISGLHQNYQGTVRHISHSFVFIYIDGLDHNNGWVVKLCNTLIAIDSEHEYSSSMPGRHVDRDMKRLMRHKGRSTVRSDLVGKRVRITKHPTDNGLTGRVDEEHADGNLSITLEIDGKRKRYAKDQIFDPSNIDYSSSNATVMSNPSQTIYSQPQQPQAVSFDSGNGFGMGSSSGFGFSAANDGFGETAFEDNMDDFSPFMTNFEEPKQAQLPPSHWAFEHVIVVYQNREYKIIETSYPHLKIQDLYDPNTVIDTTTEWVKPAKPQVGDWAYVLEGNQKDIKVKIIQTFEDKAICETSHGQSEVIENNLLAKYDFRY
eukprot:TRINITY_DN3231_c2_g2_i1.p1 TRINITY_DN3231_c2_g2~~TRINITY_DN3231_c2_g2_i1.p1  ORF type:complete len:875 (+),score=282.12 TRINITY_DN3231_c2_g2_i1:78-2702(+)